jgi:hypothetical protein
MKAALPARWAALRALHGGAPAGIELLAEATGRSAAALQKRADAEGWTAARRGGWAGETREERIARLMDHILDLMEEVASQEVLDKGRIESVSALVRILEKLSEVTRSESGAKENHARRDGEIADVLGRIDERIIELAEAYARRLVEEGNHGGTGGPDPR